MTWTIQKADTIYKELRAVSKEILTKIGCHTEPHAVNGKGKTRTCKFLPHKGQERYRGILYHYTAGVAEIGTMRWGNHPGWGNNVCSWHVTILDRMSDTVVGEIWSKIDNELRLLFPVPTIIMANWKWGTWHGNWTCNTTLGVENRNSGHAYLLKGGKDKLDKDPIVINGRTLEPYTREQMICNVNIGRLANWWIDDQLDPDWVLSHQCVWATKHDTGFAYPIHDVRNAIFIKDPIDEIRWLAAFPMAPDKNIDVDEEFEPLNEFRYEAENKFVKWVKPAPNAKGTAEPAWVAAQLYRIGFNVGPELPNAVDMTKMIRWFQRSTGAYKKKHPEWVLKPDGVAGPKTVMGITRRLKQLKLM